MCIRDRVSLPVVVHIVAVQDIKEIGHTILGVYRAGTAVVLFAQVEDVYKRQEVFLAPRFDLTVAPAGDFCLTVAQGVQLVYTEQDCTCLLYTSRCV